MTREEAKDLFITNRDVYGKPRSIMSKIDKIYMDFEKQLEEVSKKSYIDGHNDCYKQLIG